MKRIVLFIIICIAAVRVALAQEITPAVTVYPEFKPAVIMLDDGRKLKQPLANIFLKNSSLLYKQGVQTMEANLAHVLSVEFDDRTYIKIDSLLAYLVDTVGVGALYCAKRIDLVAYCNTLANNKVITNMNLGEIVSTSTISLSDEDDIHFPIIPLYYFRINDKMVFVHERNLNRILSKEKRRIMKSIMAQDGFSWTDESWLLRLLKAIQ